MDSRRDFIKKASLLAAGGGLAGLLPGSIQRAFAIDPAPGTTYLDADHVVILMQENRSFDHCYGALRGVRGFNDPRAISLPNGNPVWLQSNAAGETYAPFRLNIKETNVTWIGGLPHSWVDQVDAGNGGKHDQWLIAKTSGHKGAEHMPFSLGFYERDDIPFYYSLADAFTVCDQNFCSSLTGTTPNRLYLWTGTIREKPSMASKANVRNSDVDYGREASWTTFPERLEDAGISWCVYQNELSLATGLEGEYDNWLSNFTDNPLEWFKQYHVNFSATHRAHLAKEEKSLSDTLARIKAGTQSGDAGKVEQELKEVRRELATYTDAAWAKLPPREQNLHRKGFSTNTGDPHYRELTTLTYSNGGKQHQMEAPKGDVLHQFRQDVATGKLPAVSWIVAPSNFSDHPGSPWFGAWYVSETLDILTRNPEVWKKTIFILCYDENDGYFDHIPPFAAPHPGHPETGKASADIDTAAEQVPPSPGEARSGPIGLGYRVPLVIASPWSRGGYVCSQVFDHTSILQLMEKWLSHKTGKAIRESNITSWRRVICGDLTAVFRPYNGEKIELPVSVKKDAHLEQIHQARTKRLPSGFKSLSAEDIKQAREDLRSVAFVPRQEKGPRPSCALPYELESNGQLSADRKSFTIEFAANKNRFRAQAAGAPFQVYALGKGRVVSRLDLSRPRNYAVSAGDRISDSFKLNDFQDNNYHLRVHGPNGFFREFLGGGGDPLLEVFLRSDQPVFNLVNRDKANPITVTLEPLAYEGLPVTMSVKPDSKSVIPLDLEKSHGWYDFRVRVQGVTTWEQRFAGRFETGQESLSDPLLDLA